MNQQALSSLIWSVADLLRGDFKQSEYGRVILPFTVLRRLDCVLAPTKAEVLKEYAAKQAAGIAFEPFAKRKAGLDFYNVSSLDMGKLMGDQDNVRANLDSYIQGFAPDVRSIFEHFDFAATVERLHKAKLLYLVTEKFAGFNLHPSSVDNMQMGLVFEELIRKFAEISNETAGEHFTPREVIRLMVNLLFIEDSDALTKPGVVRTMYDPTAGTGGMLSVAGEYLAELNPKARLTLFGQELNPESHAICKADMLIRGQDISNIVLGNTLSDDGLLGKLFDYMLSNPPFGVEWKKIEKAIRDEYEKQGYNGRFGPGLPRVSDGSLLFLLHLLSKMRPAVQGGSRVGIVLNGSPLFTGGAGSGESEIRRYVLENDLVEAIVALPTDMFYNTGISTYIWILSNRKPDDRKGYVQLIDASSFWQKMRKSLGSKRKEMSDEHISQVTRMFGDFVEASLVTVVGADGKEVGRQVMMDGETLPTAPAGGKVKAVPVSRIFRNEDFGYRTITVERPLYDEQGKKVLGAKGKGKGLPVADSSVRDTENVPLSEEVQPYFIREVLPHAHDAWVDHEKTKVGYEIPFNRHFYVFEPPRDLAEIDTDLKKVTDRIKAMIEGLTDPDNVLTLKAKLDGQALYEPFEVDRVVNVALKGKKAKQSELDAATTPVASRLLVSYAEAKKAFEAAPPSSQQAQAAKDRMDALILFKSDIAAYVRMYGFLSQIFDYGNTDLEKRSIFFRLLHPLLTFGREREGVDLSALKLTAYTIKNIGDPDLNLGAGDAVQIDPTNDGGTGAVQDKTKIALAELIAKLNDLFEGDLTPGDKLVYVNDVIKGKLMESERLTEQAANNTKEQFNSSPDLDRELEGAIMDALSAHSAMSKQALESATLRADLKAVLLGAGKLWEGLRAKAVGDGAVAGG